MSWFGFGFGYFNFGGEQGGSGGGPPPPSYTPALKFNDVRNSQYLALIF